MVLPGRRDVLRGAALAVAAPLLGGCAPGADPYRPITREAGATTGAAPATASMGRRTDFQGAAVRVPERASRVVTLGDACLQPALDLGAPVVAVTASAPAVVPPSRRSVLRALPVVGSGRAGDPLTAQDVLAPGPDLVLVTEATPQRLVDEVGVHVPVVVVRTTGRFRSDWQGRIRGLADVLGLDTAAGLEARYADRAARIRRSQDRILAVSPVVVLRAWDRTSITAYGPGSVIGRIYADAGARFVPAVQPSASRVAVAPGEFRDTLDHVDRYLAGARIVMLASDYAGGLDAFTGGSLANSDAVKGHVRAHGAVLQGAGVMAVTSYAQVDFILDQFVDALTRLGKS